MFLFTSPHCCGYIWRRTLSNKAQFSPYGKFVKRHDWIFTCVLTQQRDFPFFRQIKVGGGDNRIDAKRGVNKFSFSRRPRFPPFIPLGGL